MCAGDFCLIGACSWISVTVLPVANSALQPSATQTPWSSYPQVLPRRHAAPPKERTRTTPCEVSAGQRFLLPASEVQVTVVGRCCATAGVATRKSNGRILPLGKHTPLLGCRGG